MVRTAIGRDGGAGRPSRLLAGPPKPCVTNLGRDASEPPGPPERRNWPLPRVFVAAQPSAATPPGQPRVAGAPPARRSGMASGLLESTK
jgi:hypothetical protein